MTRFRLSRRNKDLVSSYWPVMSRLRDAETENKRLGVKINELEERHMHDTHETATQQIHAATKLAEKYRSKWETGRMYTEDLESNVARCVLVVGFYMEGLGSQS